MLVSGFCALFLLFWFAVISGFPEFLGFLGLLGFLVLWVFGFWFSVFLVSVVFICLYLSFYACSGLFVLM